MIADHPRVASVDSQAWDMQARAERRTGRDMDFRIGHMEAWTVKQQAIARRTRPSAAGVQTMLFDPAAFGGINDSESLVLEALALQYADLVMDGDVEYLDAVHYAARDGVAAVAILRNQGLTAESMEAFDELVAGLADRIYALRAEG